MKLKKPIKLSQILGQIQFSCKIIGNTDVFIYGFNDDAVANIGDMTWLTNKNHFNNAVKSGIHCIITSFIPSYEVNENICILIVRDPLELFDKCLELYSNEIMEDADNLIESQIGAHVIIGKNVRIGKNCIIYPFVTILDNVTIGNNVVIQSNSVIGSMPFANIRKKNGMLQSRKTWGDVKIGNNVEIGALCTIDRGITSTTLIGDGTKIDNQVHIGHDVSIGHDCLFSAQVGIAGYVEIKDRCSFWGKSSVTNRVTIAHDTTVLGMSVVTKSIKAEGMTLIGFPAEDRLTHWKDQIALKKIIK